MDNFVMGLLFFIAATSPLFLGFYWAGYIHGRDNATKYALKLMDEEWVQKDKNNVK